jgi:hypothetical protein
LKDSNYFMTKQLNIFEEETSDDMNLMRQLEVSKVKVELNDNVFSRKINKTIKQIASLEEKIVKTKEDVKLVNEIYHKEIKPIESLYLEQKLEYVKNLLNFISKKNIPQKYQEEALHQINVNMEILNLSNFLTAEAREELNQKLNILQEQYNVNFDSGVEKEMDFEMMQNAFEEESGVDLGLDFSDYEHLTLDEMEEMFRKRFTEYFHDQQKQDTQERKKKNQELDDQYFKKIYKNLIKKLHPDLQSEIKDEDKKELILTLTEAWEKRDYLKILEINQLLNGNVDYDNMPENVLEEFHNSLREKLKVKEQEWQEIRDGKTKEYHWYNVLFAQNKKTLTQNIAKVKYDIKTATSDLKRGNKDIFKSVNKTKDFLGEFIEDSWLDDDLGVALEDDFEDEDMMGFMEEFIMEEKKKGNNKKKKK